ncbi:MAG: nickel pincer cofactor biosynthesis protein LarC [Pirellulales bacterium]|nr:nickel pincer cofactor biosynthesis protein LarC [Pirellulales bacterium]
MRLAYLDCLSGISGDMTLGALVDAGADLAAIQTLINSLGLPSCRLVATTVKKHGFRATQITVEHEPEHKHRHLHHIVKMIDGSGLSPRQQELAKRIFGRLAEAEAKVHGSTIEKVHFHEVGAVDSIADVVGAAIGFDLLGIERVVCSPVPTGQGFITIAHGRVSVPAPATAELLRGVPLASSSVECELTTPTGAAIATALAEVFGPVPAMKIESIGYGAGQRELAEQPNVLRLLVGEAVAEPTAAADTNDTVWVLETNLDNVTGEVIGYTTTRLFEAGALDVYTTAIGMKKNRPGVKLTVLCAHAELEKIEPILFRETTTLGVRRWLAQRHKLERSALVIDTPFGKIAGKLRRVEGQPPAFAPEYDDCARVAAERGVPLQTVFDAARRAFAAE